MTAVEAAALAAIVGAVLTAGVRWLRVAQREHYLSGSVTRFALRWCVSSSVNLGAGAAGVIATVLTFVWPTVAFVAAAVLLAAPIGLSLRGRTSKLKWTRRLRTTAATSALLMAVPVSLSAAFAGLGGAVRAAVVVALASPVLVDLALLTLAPIEDVLAERYVRQARTKLDRVRPRVVAVTGSFGKTTTKGYIAHLVAGRFNTLASPASYNNRPGLARTVNEHLGPGTGLFIAEMGTYGRGEIRALCSWIVPEISVITAIGPAHLERFRSLDRTLEAKSEIAERARVVVLNVDDERLAGLAERLAVGGKSVVRASARQREADVAVLSGSAGLELYVAGQPVGTSPVEAGEQPAALSNAACAAAVALELGTPPDEILARLASLPSAPNRLQRYVAEGGYVVLDDTFNSNPTGARMALGRLAAEAPGGRRVLVTPGMVELGRTQAVENARLAAEASHLVTDLVAVARTNRRALVEGAGGALGPAAGPRGQAEVHVVDTLPQAVEWVRRHLGPGDAVLYENDLPDHFP